MIDLRSDTVTKPTPAMRQVIANAIVGDDVWGDDPTINLLQDKMCELTGKEAALYVPSGTMSNQIAIAVHTNSGDEIIFESSAHIFKYEAGAPAIISRVMMKALNSTDGMPDINEIKNAIRPIDVHFPYTKMICLENTHNFHGGRIVSLDYIKEVENLAKENNIIFHCDGARLWNASVATGISIKEYCSHFDTVSLCMSKGMGAPVGSVLVGTKEQIFKAKRIRKALGGGMRQSGLLAAACIYALDNNFDRLKDDHDNAKLFADKLKDSNYIDINPDTVDTNIVFFRIVPDLDQNLIIEKCKDLGVLIGAAGYKLFRAVFHLEISKEDSVFAADSIINIIEKLNSDGK